MQKRNTTDASKNRTKCEDCPLAKLHEFREFTPPELKFVSSFKQGEMAIDKGHTLLVEGAHSAHLYTVLLGWGFRYKILEDGRRQILNYLVPGDLIGLQGALMEEMQHSVESLTPMTLCIFARGKLPELYRNYPSLGYDLTWMAAREEQILDHTLTSVGRRTALEKIAYLLALLYQRAQKSGAMKNSNSYIPITQHHLADTLGMSVVHCNKTLKTLASQKLIRWGERECYVLDIDGLMSAAKWEGMDAGARPFI